VLLTDFQHKLAANMIDVLVLFANALWFVVTACCTAGLPKQLLLPLPSSYPPVDYYYFFVFSLLFLLLHSC